jgi:23S rRNA pseudouridine1911/1915/1917 synthase
LSVLFEDEALVVIDKPAGLVTHPGAGSHDATLVQLLLAHTGGQLASVGAPLRPGIVHRLDKGTSGVMVVAKTDAAHHHLAKQFSAHSIERAYQAVVLGLPQPWPWHHYRRNWAQRSQPPEDGDCQRAG